MVISDATCTRGNRVLLTGATGPLGVHVLRECIQAGVRVAVLVRATSLTHATARLSGAVDKCFGSLNSRVPENFLSSTTVLVGDLTRDGTVGDESALRDLAAEGPWEVWHFAQLSNIDEVSGAELETANVEMARRALALARRLQSARFVFRSYGRPQPGRAGRATVTGRGSVAAQAFVRGNAEAEGLVLRECAVSGIQSRIVRCPFVIGSTSTCLPVGTRKGLYRLLSRVSHEEWIDWLETGRLSESATHAMLVPVDEAAAKIVKGLQVGESGDAATDLVVGRSIRLAAAVRRWTERGARGTRGDAQRLEDNPWFSLLCQHFNAGESELALAETNEHVDRFADAYAQGEQIDSVFSHRIVTVRDGTCVSAFYAGDPENPPIILVNAYGMPNDFWEPLARELEPSYRLLSWESRGVPNLEPSFDPNRSGVAVHAQDLIDVALAAGVTSAFVIGWCSGAQVTLRASAIEPTLVQAAVFINGAFSLGAGHEKTTFEQNLATFLPLCLKSRAVAGVYSRMLLGQSPDSGSASGQHGPATLGAVSTIPSSVLRLAAGAFCDGERLFRYAHMHEELLAGPEHLWAGDCFVPVLLVYSDADPMTHPCNTSVAASLLRSATLHAVREGDHYIHYNDPSIIAPIRSFLRNPISGPVSPMRQSIAQTHEG